MSSLGLLAEFAPRSRGREQRRAERRELRFESMLTSQRPASKVVVLNLSEVGLMLHAREDLAVGETFAVALDDGEAAEARVVWKSAPLYGCRFVSAVTRAMISAALLRADPARTQPPADGSTQR